MVIWVNHTRHERKMSGPRVYFQGICLVFAKGEYLMPNKDQKIFNDWIKTFRLINTILFWHETLNRQIYLIGLTIKISSLTNYNGLNHRQQLQPSKAITSLPFLRPSSVAFCSPRRGWSSLAAPCWRGPPASQVDSGPGPPCTAACSGLTCSCPPTTLSTWSPLCPPTLTPLNYPDLYLNRRHMMLISHETPSIQLYKAMS